MSSWNLMGQPIHTLTAHVGKSQLWAVGSLMANKSAHFGSNLHRLRGLTRMVALFFLRPPFLTNRHWWRQEAGFVDWIVSRLRFTSPTAALPDVRIPTICQRYYRKDDDIALFKESDLMLFEGGVMNSLTSDKMLWARARFFYTRGSLLTTVRGLPLRGALLEKANLEPFLPEEASFLWWEYTYHTWRASLKVSTRTPLQQLQRWI